MTSAFASAPHQDSFDLSVNMDNGTWYSARLMSSEDRFLTIVREACLFGSAPVFQRDDQSGTLLSGTGLEFSDVANDCGMWQQLRSLTTVPSEVRSALDMLVDYSIYAPQVDFLRGQAAGLTPPTSVGLHGEGLPAAVQNILRLHTGMKGKGKIEANLIIRALDLAFLPGWANQVQVAPLDDRYVSRAVMGKGHDAAMLYFEDKYMEPNRKKLSVYDSSEGTLFLLFVAALLVHSDSPRIFALDNVDNGLNPKMTREMIERLIEIVKTASESELDCGPRQVFLTSHNPTALDAFDLFDSDHRVFVVKRNEVGHTEITRLKPPEEITIRDDWVALRHGNSLSKLWIEGLIPDALGPKSEL